MAEKKITNEELGKKMFKHSNTIGTWKNAEIPSLKLTQLSLLVNALECSISDIIEFID